MRDQFNPKLGGATRHAKMKNLVWRVLRDPFYKSVRSAVTYRDNIKRQAEVFGQPL
jgi:hypothetical protein